MPKHDPAKLKKVSISLPFGIGSAEWEADTTERKAAWSLYVELVTRIAVQSLEVDQGLVREALNSLYSLFGTTREVLKAAGPDVGASKNSVGGIAIAVLNKEIYLSVGGKPDGIFNQSIWRKFSDLVGWVGKDANGCNFFYDSEEEFTFDISAHKGHLPVLIEDYQEIIIDIFARIEACPQFNKDPLKLLNSHLGFQPDTSVIKAVEIINSLPNI